MDEAPKKDRIATPLAEDGKRVETTTDPSEGGSLAPPSRRPTGGARPGAGRPPGKPNMATMLRQLAGDTQEVYERMGGVDGFEEWARANPDRFYPMAMQTAKALADGEARKQDQRKSQGPTYITVHQPGEDGQKSPLFTLVQRDRAQRQGWVEEDGNAILEEDQEEDHEDE